MRGFDRDAFWERGFRVSREDGSEKKSLGDGRSSVKYLIGSLDFFRISFWFLSLSLFKNGRLLFSFVLLALVLGSR